MRAIFLCDSPHNVKRVYDGDAKAEIGARVTLSKDIYTKADVLAAPARFRDAEIVFSTWGMPEFSAEEIQAYLPSLKYLFYGAGSVQRFARPFLEAGVRVFSAWGANAVPVAEMTVAEIILANKGHYLTSRLFGAGKYRAAKEIAEKCRGNYGESVGIIGAGMVGSLVIRMLRAYRLRVLVFDPFLSDERAAELGVTKCDLETLFSTAFVVSNHLANNRETVGMLHGGLFRLMRENAVFLNTGRGAQVVEADLAATLRERPDLTAILDVTYPEPPVEGHPFYTLENCILTPHIAGSAGDEVRRMGAYMAAECKALLTGEPCRWEVTAPMLQTMA